MRVYIRGISIVNPWGDNKHTLRKFAAANVRTSGIWKLSGFAVSLLVSELLPTSSSRTRRSSMELLPLRLPSAIACRCSLVFCGAYYTQLQEGVLTPLSTQRFIATTHLTILPQELRFVDDDAEGQMTGI